MGLRQRQGTYKLTSSGTSFFSRGNKPNRRLKLKTRRTLRRCGYTGSWKPLCLAWDQLTPVNCNRFARHAIVIISQSSTAESMLHRSLRTGPIIPSIHFIRIKYNTSKITVLNNPLNYCMKISSYLKCIQHY